jgi:hypothetical protein
MVRKRGMESSPGLVTLSYFCLSPTARSPQPPSRRLLRRPSQGTWRCGDLMRGPLGPRVRRLLRDAPSCEKEAGFADNARSGNGRSSNGRHAFAVPAIRKRCLKTAMPSHALRRISLLTHGSDQSCKDKSLLDSATCSGELQCVGTRLCLDTDDESERTEDDDTFETQTAAEQYRAADHPSKGAFPVFLSQLSQ